MSNTQEPEALPPVTVKEQPPPKWRRWLSIAIGIVVIIFGGFQLSQYFILPGCDAARVTDAIREIFTERDLKLMTLNEVKALPDTDVGKVCSARFETTDEKGNLQYTVGWEGGWSAMVRIASVDVTSPAPDAAPAPDTAPAAEPAPAAEQPQ